MGDHVAEQSWQITDTKGLDKLIAQWRQACRTLGEEGASGKDGSRLHIQDGHHALLR